jgi:ubiquinone/menaquinone biosynthesis C-methylase UbiE
MEELSARVDRERLAHEAEDDVLAKAQELKERFHHVTKTQAYEDMDRLFADLIASMRGKTVLDYGCGRGEMSVKYLAAGAAAVVGIDISEKYVDEARQRCNAEFRVMDAHKLEFAEESFDFVVGKGILHHLDLKTALMEIKRVLKPGGRAMFLEPLADNPLLRLFRKLTPEARTVDEKPLGKSDLDFVTSQFESRSYHFGMLTAPVAVLTSIVLPSRPRNVLGDIAHAIEGFARRRRLWDHWHQYVLLDLVKRA